MDKSSKELLDALQNVQNSFAKETMRIADPDSEEPVTKKELSKIIYEISSALQDIETAFDNYFYEK